MSRDYLLKLSVSTSLIAKVLAMLLQLVTLPIAAKNLGADGLVIYAMLLSINSWLLLTTSGISPALVLRLSGTNNKKLLLCWSTNGYFIFAGIGFIIFLLSLALNQFSNISSFLFSSEGINAKRSLNIIVCIFLFQCLCIASDAIILASQKQYITNLALLIASSISLYLLYAVNTWIDSPSKLITIVMLPSLIIRILIGTVFIIYERLLSIRLLRLKYQRILLKTAFEFFKAGSLTNFLLHVFPIIIIGKLYASDFSAQYASLNTLIIVASSTFAIICTPLLPALRESIKSGDIDWFSRSVQKLKKYCLSLVIISLILGWTFATFILNEIYPKAVRFEYIYVGLAATYFSTLMWSNYHYTLLSAANEIKLLSVVFMKKAIFSVIMVLLFAIMKIELPPFAIFIFAFFIFEYAKLKTIINKISYVKNTNSN